MRIHCCLFFCYFPFDNINSYTGSNNVAVVAGLVPDTLYYFRVFAVDAAGTAGDYVQINVTTSPRSK